MASIGQSSNRFHENDPLKFPAPWQTSSSADYFTTTPINRMSRTQTKDKETMYDQKTLPARYVRETPARTLSFERMGEQWDSAVKVGRWPRIIYATVGLILLAVWIGIM
jgi:hypothetical protein